MSRSLLGCALAALLVFTGCSEKLPVSVKTSATMQLDRATGVTPQPAPQCWPGRTRFYSFAETMTTGFVDYMKIDPVTGHGTILWRLGVPLPPPDFSFVPCPLGLTYDFDGTMYTIVNWVTYDSLTSYSRLARVNEKTGAVTYIGSPYPQHFSGPEIGPDGMMYAVGFHKPDQFSGATVFVGDNCLYRFNKRTGTATRLGDVGITIDAIMDLAFDSRGRLWATTHNKLYLLDTRTGHATLVTDIKGVPQDHPPMEVMTIAFNDDNVLYATAIIGFCTDYCGPALVMTIDVRTGRATLIGDTDQFFNHGGDTKPR